MYWGSYETMKAYVLSNKGRSNLNFLESFAAGAIAGSVKYILIFFYYITVLIKIRINI